MVFMDAVPGPDDLSLFHLRPNQNFKNVVVAVVDKKMRVGSNGSPFVALRVRDATDTRNAKWFNPPADVEAQLDGATLLSLNGQVDGSPNFMGDLRLSHAAPVGEPDDLSPFLPPLPEDHLAHQKRFAELLKSVQNPHLNQLLRTVFSGEFWDRFCAAPAAKNMHHAYRGGLLEHSGEVALLCDRCCATLPYIHRDLLVASALLHDIGKLEEMEADLRAGEYTTAGQLVGHIVLGAHTVATAAEGLEEFPPLLKHEVLHLILSHHGRPEFGAAKVPMCAEAVILSLCDMMSARIAQCHMAAGGGDSKDPFPKVFGWETSNIYVGPMREMMAQQP